MERKVPSLDRIRARLAQDEERRSGKSTGKSSGGDNSYFAFWNTPEGGQTVIRFLPDENPSNDYFWVEKLHINLTFNGIRGQSNDQVTVRVPCMEMYNEQCPILNEIRPWWKDESLTELARKYWKKRSYLFQGFVVSTDYEEENIPENPIRKFSISPGIYEKVKSALTDPDYEDNPTDFIGGRGFRLKKSKKGQYANYDNSSWIPRSEALSEEQLEAINTYGLNDLSTLLPRKPTQEEVDVIFEMFKDSMDELPYDVEKYGSFFRPPGVSAPATSSSRIKSDVAEKVLPKTSAKASVKEEVVEESDDSSTSGDDIAAIIARVNASRGK